MTHPPTVSSWKVELPFPAKILWPSGRGHWATRAKAFKAHKMWAYVEAYTAIRDSGWTYGGGRVDWSVTIHPKTRNVIDNDNARASLKAYQDGLAMALGVDDSRFNAPSLTFGEPIKGGKVIIKLEAA